MVSILSFRPKSIDDKIQQFVSGASERRRRLLPPNHPVVVGLQLGYVLELSAFPDHPHYRYAERVVLLDAGNQLSLPLRKAERAPSGDYTWTLCEKDYHGLGARAMKNTLGDFDISISALESRGVPYTLYIGGNLC